MSAELSADSEGRFSSKDLWKREDKSATGTSPKLSLTKEAF